MTVTHILIGMALGTTSYIFDPALLYPAVLGGLVGGLLPDIDLLFEHRKTLHMPYYYSIAALISGVFLFLYTAPVTAFIAYLTASLSIHSLLDIFSGGLAPKRYKAQGDFPVYDHLHGKWITNDVIRYDGSIEDFLISLVLAAPLIYLLEGFRYLTAFLLILSTSYYVFRMRWHLFSLKALGLEE